MTALVLVDIQNDFLPGGALPVPEGDAIIPVVNRLLPGFGCVVATQDWHPPEHGSFAANHPGRRPLEEIDLDGVSQRLWPTHCVQYTGGALFAPGLETRHITRVFPKGTNPRVDSYSGFFDNDHRQSTGLGEWLEAQSVTDLWIAGLATDYCVRHTVLDALKAGFRVAVVEDACRGVGIPPGHVAEAWAAMRQAGARIVSSDACLA